MHRNESIHSWLANNGPATVAEIAQGTGGRSTRIIHDLLEMERWGEVRRTEKVRQRNANCWRWEAVA